MSLNLRRLFVALAISCLVTESSPAWGAFSQPSLSKSMFSWTSQALALPSLVETRSALAVRKPRELYRFSTRFWREVVRTHQNSRLTPARRISAHLRMGSVVEVVPDSAGKLTGYSVHANGHRTSRRVELDRVFSQSQRSFLEETLTSQNANLSSLAIRILLGEGFLIYQSGDALYIGELWVLSKELSLRDVEHWPPAREIQDHSQRVIKNISQPSIDYSQKHLLLLSEGRRSGLPMTIQTRAEARRRDPLVPQGLIITAQIRYGLRNMYTLNVVQPLLAEVLSVSGNRRANDSALEYPDLVSLVARLALIDPVWGTFWLALGDGQASLEAVARFWDEEGAMPIQELGPFHYHDWDDHAIGYVAFFLMKEAVMLSRVQMRFIRRLLRNPRIQSHPEWASFLEKERKNIIESLDSLSAQLNAYVHTRNIHRTSEQKDRDIAFIMKRLSRLTSNGRSVPALLNFWQRKISWPKEVLSIAQRLAERYSMIPNLTRWKMKKLVLGVLKESDAGFPSFAPALLKTRA